MNNALVAKRVSDQHVYMSTMRLVRVRARAYTGYRDFVRTDSWSGAAKLCVGRCIPPFERAMSILVPLPLPRRSLSRVAVRVDGRGHPLLNHYGQLGREDHWRGPLVRACTAIRPGG